MASNSPPLSASRKRPRPPAPSEDGAKRTKKKKAPLFASVTFAVGGIEKKKDENAAPLARVTHTMRRGQPLYFGRSPSQSSVVVRHKSVSRRHLQVRWPKRKLPSAVARELKRQGLCLVVCDEDSMNGSYFERAMIVDQDKRDEVRVLCVLCVCVGVVRARARVCVCVCGRREGDEIEEVK